MGKVFLRRESAKDALLYSNYCACSTCAVLSFLTVDIPTKRNEEIQNSKYDIRLNQLIVVQFSQELDTAHSSLVELWVVNLQAETNVFENGIHHSNHSIFLHNKHETCEQQAKQGTCSPAGNKLHVSKTLLL